MSEIDYDLAVVGGGISGLGFAHFAAERGLKTLLLEASDQLGGCIRTHEFHTPEGPFWAELGAHTCYNSYGNLLQILQDTGQLDRLQAKQKLRYQLQATDGLKPIPSELNYWELLGVVPRLLLTQKTGRTAGDYFARVIGKHNFERVLGPALDAVICQPARDFPADALFRKKPRRKDVIRSFTGPRGLQDLLGPIATRAGIVIRTGSPVERLECLEQGYRVDMAGTEPVTAAALALAVAPDVAARLLHPIHPELTELCSRIGMVEVESVAVLLRAATCELPPLAGIIGRDDMFYSVVSRDLVPDPGYRAFTFHFRPERLGDEGKLQRICQVLGIEAAAIESSISYDNRLPALRLGHAELIAELDRRLSGRSLALTGNWFSGVSIEDSLVRSAEEFRRLFPA